MGIIQFEFSRHALDRSTLRGISAQEIREAIQRSELLKDTPTISNATKLTKQEEQELDLYEEIDDYLSFVNRIIHSLC